MRQPINTINHWQTLRCIASRITSTQLGQRRSIRRPRHSNGSPPRALFFKSGSGSPHTANASKRFKAWWPKTAGLLKKRTVSQAGNSVITPSLVLGSCVQAPAAAGSSLRGPGPDTGVIIAMENGGRDAPLIKSRDPQLAGGEQLYMGVNNPQRTNTPVFESKHPCDIPHLRVL